jgi:hypothetical protein
MTTVSYPTETGQHRWGPSGCATERVSLRVHPEHTPSSTIMEHVGTYSRRGQTPPPPPRAPTLQPPTDPTETGQHRWGHATPPGCATERVSLRVHPEHTPSSTIMEHIGTYSRRGQTPPPPPRAPTLQPPTDRTGATRAAAMGGGVNVIGSTLDSNAARLT